MTHVSVRGQAYKRALGAVVRARREEMSHTQQSLGSACDVAAATISDLELGKASPHMRTLLAVTRELRLSMGDLFTAADAKMEMGDE